MKTFQQFLAEMTDQALIEALMTCDQAVLIDVQREWDRRHPEDPIHRTKD